MILSFCLFPVAHVTGNPDISRTARYVPPTPGGVRVALCHVWLAEPSNLFISICIFIQFIPYYL